MLGHLVEETLQGRKARLTQRHLAQDVFSRGSTFDPETDAIVRVELGKLRRFLEAFYAEHGSGFPVTIVIPRGGYVPVFEFRQLPTVNPRLEHQDLIAIDVVIEPFADHGSRQDRRWIAQTLHEELKTRLGRVPCLRILGNRAATHWKQNQQGQHVPVQGLPHRFLLGGSVTCVGTQVRVVARLHAIDSDQEIWSQRYDRYLESGSLFEVQEDIANQVIAASLDPFTGVVGQQLRNLVWDLDELRHPDMSLATYRGLMQYIRYQHQMTDDAYQSARDTLESAHASDPDDPLVLSMLGDLRRAGYTFCFSEEKNCLEEITDWHRSLVGGQSQQSWYRVSLGFSLLVAGELDEARDNARVLLQDRMTPWSTKADAALQLALAGDWEEGGKKLAIYQSGLGEYPAYLDYIHCLASYRDGNYDNAWEQSRSLRPNGLFWGPMLQAASLGKLGRDRDACKAVHRLLALRPDFADRANHYLSMFVADQGLRQNLLEGLKRCGVRISG